MQAACGLAWVERVEEFVEQRKVNLFLFCNLAPPDPEATEKIRPIPCLASHHPERN